MAVDLDNLPHDDFCSVCNHTINHPGDAISRRNIWRMHLQSKKHMKALESQNNPPDDSPLPADDKCPQCGATILHDGSPPGRRNSWLMHANSKVHIRALSQPAVVDQAPPMALASAAPSATPPQPTRGDNAQPASPVAQFDVTGGVLNPELLGRGSYGDVHKYTTLCGRTICVKIVEKNEKWEFENRHIQQLKNEYQVVQRLSHTNIIQHYECVYDAAAKQLRLFMEFVPGGTLSSRVKAFKNTIPLVTIRDWTRQLTAAVAYLHDHGVVHRDIKGSNVLLGVGGELKLADFGGSKALSEMRSNALTTFTGTVLWMAPEVAKGDVPYGPKCDVWSIGCTVVEMIQGRPPWPVGLQPIQAIHRVASHNELLPPDMPKDLDSSLLDFLKQCFAVDPSQRSSAHDLLQHRFLV